MPKNEPLRNGSDVRARESRVRTVVARATTALVILLLGGFVSLVPWDAPPAQALPICRVIKINPYIDNLSVTFDESDPSRTVSISANVDPGGWYENVDDPGYDGGATGTLGCGVGGTYSISTINFVGSGDLACTGNCSGSLDGSETLFTGQTSATFNPTVGGYFSVYVTLRNSINRTATSETVAFSIGPRSTCGDGVITYLAGEVCDGASLGGMTCSGLGYTGPGGPPACSADCRSFVQGDCDDLPPGGYCGDGIKNNGEQCDGSDVSGTTCQANGYPAGGSVSCNPFDSLDPSGTSNGCTYNFLGCNPTGSGQCGNSIIETNLGEQCDRAELDGETCASMGYSGGGILSCSGVCQFDSSDCKPGAGHPLTCGNGVQEPWEVCDGSDLNGRTCLNEAGQQYGDLLCASDCNSFVTTGCHNAECGNGIADPGEACDGGDLRGNACTPVLQTGSYSCSGDCTTLSNNCSNVVLYPWIIGCRLGGSGLGNTGYAVNAKDGINHDPLGTEVKVDQVQFRTIAGVLPWEAIDPSHEIVSWNTGGLTRKPEGCGVPNQACVYVEATAATGTFNVQATVQSGIDVVNCSMPITVVPAPNGSLSPGVAVGYLNDGTVSLSSTFGTAPSTPRGWGIRIVDASGPSDTADFISWPSYPDGNPTPPEAARWMYLSDGYPAGANIWDSRVAAISAGTVTLKPSPGSETTPHWQHVEAYYGDTQNIPGQVRWGWGGRGNGGGDFSMVEWRWKAPTCAAGIGSEGGPAATNADIGETISLVGRGYSASGAVTTPGLGDGSWSVVSGPGGGSLGSQVVSAPNGMSTTFVPGDPGGTDDRYVLRYSNSDAGGGASCDVTIHVKDYRLRLTAVQNGALNRNPTTTYTYTLAADFFNGYTGQAQFTPPITLTGTPTAIFDSGATPANISACAAGGVGADCTATTSVAFVVPGTEPPATPFQMPGSYTFTVTGNALNGQGLTQSRSTSSGLNLSCPLDNTAPPAGVVLKEPTFYDYWMQTRTPQVRFDNVYDTGLGSTPRQCLLTSRYEYNVRPRGMAPAGPWTTFHVPLPADYTSSPPAEVRFNAPSMPDGRWTLYVRAVDNYGNPSAVNGSIGYNIDNVPPTVSSFTMSNCVAPNCISNGPATTYYFKGTAPQISATAQDPWGQPNGLSNDDGATWVNTTGDKLNGHVLAELFDPGTGTSILTTNVLPPPGDAATHTAGYGAIGTGEFPNGSASGSGGGWNASVNYSSAVATSRIIMDWSLTPQVPNVCPAMPRVQARVTPTDQAHNGGASVASSIIINADEVAPQVTQEVYSTGTYAALPADPATVEHPWVQDSSPGVAPTFNLTWGDLACTTASPAGLGQAQFAWTAGSGVITVSGGSQPADRTYAGAGGADLTDTAVGTQVPYLENEFTVTLTDKVGNQRVETTVFRRCIEDLLGPDKPGLAGPATLKWQSLATRTATLTVTNPSDNGTIANALGTYPGGVVPPQCTNTLRRYRAITVTNAIGGPRVAAPADTDPGWSIVLDPAPGGGAAGATGSIPVPAPSDGLGWRQGWFTTYVMVSDTSQTQENWSVPSDGVDILIDTTAPALVPPMTITNCGASCYDAGGSTYYFSSNGGSYRPQLLSTITDGFPGTHFAALPGGLDATSIFDLNLSVLPSTMTLRNDTQLGPVATATGDWNGDVVRTSHNSVTSTDTQTWQVAPAAPAACPAAQTITASAQATDQAGNAGASTGGGITLRYDNQAPQVTRETYVTPATASLPATHGWTQVPAQTTLQVTDAVCAGGSDVGVRTILAHWSGGGPGDPVPGDSSFSYGSTPAADHQVTTAPPLQVPFLEHTLTLTSTDKVGNQRVETSDYKQCYVDTLAPPTPAVDNAVSYATWNQDRRPTFTWTNPLDAWPSTGPNGNYPGGIVPFECRNQLAQYKIAIYSNPLGGAHQPPPAYPDPTVWADWTPASTAAGASVTFTPLIDAPEGWNTICVLAVDGAPTPNVSTPDAAKCIDFYVDSVAPRVDSMSVTLSAPDCPGCVQQGSTVGTVLGDGGQSAVGSMMNVFVPSGVVSFTSTASDDKPSGFNLGAIPQTLVLSDGATVYATSREDTTGDSPAAVSFTTTNGDWEITGATMQSLDTGPMPPLTAARARNTVSWTVQRRAGLPSCAASAARVGITTEDQAGNVGGPLANSIPQSINFQIDSEAPWMTQEVYDGVTYTSFPDVPPLQHPWSNRNRTSFTFHDPSFALGCGPSSDGSGIASVEVASLPGAQPMASIPAPGDPLWQSVYSGAPQVDLTLPNPPGVPLPNRISTLYVHVTDAVGNARDYVLHYRVDLDAPTPCSISFTIDNATATASISVSGTDALNPTDSGSGIDHFSIYRSQPNGDLVTPLYTIPSADITRTMVGGMEQASATWDDVSLFDASTPLQPLPVAPDLDGSSTHATLTWSKAAQLKLKWMVQGVPGTDYGYEVRCVDRVTNASPLQLAVPPTRKYQAPEVKYELSIFTADPLSGGVRVTPANAPGPDVSEFYRDGGGAIQYLQPGDPFEVTIDVRDAGCPAYAPPLCLPSGRYFFQVTSRAGTAFVQGPPSVPLPLGSFFLDVTAPVYDVPPFSFGIVPTPAPTSYYNTPDAASNVPGASPDATYNTRRFFTNDPLKIEAIVKVRDAHSGLSAFTPYDVTRTDNPTDAARPDGVVVSSGSIPLSPVAATVSAPQEFALPANGVDAPVFGDHFTLRTTANDAVVEDPKNSTASLDSATIVFDDRVPDMSCGYVEVGGERINFVRDTPTSTPEVSVNTDTFNVWVTASDEEAHPGTYSLRSVTLINPSPGGPLVNTPGDDQYTYSNLTVSTKQTDLTIEGIDEAGNYTDLICRVVYYPEVHVDVTQAASLAGALTRKQSDNSGTASMDHVTFATTVSVPGAAGLLASYYNQADFDPSHLVASELRRDLHYPAGVAGSHTALSFRAGGSSLEHYAIRYEGRVTPPADGTYDFAFYIGAGDHGRLTLDPQLGAPATSWTNLAGMTPSDAVVASDCYPADPQILAMGTSAALSSSTWYGIQLDATFDATPGNVNDTVGLLWKKPGDTCYQVVPKTAVVFGAGDYSELVQPYTVQAKLPPGFLIDRVLDPANATTYIPDVRVRPPLTDETFPFRSDGPSSTSNLRYHIVNDVATLSWDLPGITTCPPGDATCTVGDGTNFLTKIPVGRALTILTNAHSAKAYFLPSAP